MGRILAQLKQFLHLSEIIPKISIMTEAKSVLHPPEIVRGMKQLDRMKFVKTVTVPCLVVDRLDIRHVMPVVKKSLFRMVKMSAIVDSNDGDKKVVLLNPDKIKSFCDFPEESKSTLEKLGYHSVLTNEVTISYENYTTDNVLKAILPEDKDSCASYTITGHILQINLRDHLREYEKLIGQVLLDKVPVGKTVVCKTDVIDNTYRTFAINVVCGEDTMITTVKENNCTYDLDFSKVYWNSRLSTEHMRIVNGLRKESVLYDVFAGIGPFTIPAARKGCIVLANDLNPHSFEWLKHNVKTNKVEKNVTTFNKDGADFLCTDVKTHLLELWKSDDVDAHITMNLPALAVTFLKHLHGLLPEDLKGTKQPPMVHVYCFIKNAEDPAKSAISLVESNLGAELGSCLEKVHLVRTVSTMKEMMAISFRIPPEVLFASEPVEPPAKKPCLSE